MDKVEIIVKAGTGGDGVVGFRREKFVPLGGPDGGDGGKGGGVYIKADRSMTTLSLFRHKRLFKAESGRSGAGQKKFGRGGSDLEIMVPLGTIVYKVENGENVFLDDLSQQGQKILVAKGGRGGLGNVHFATSTNQAPRKATKGESGEELRLVLDLKLIADVCIIGYPNVGKSTLLAAVSAAKPKAADYPFTTLEPVLGEVQMGKKPFILAEIPGLIEGAHQGKGLGHDFLRHAERTRVLLHLLDGSSANLVDNMNKLNKELALYQPALAQKPQIVAVNKVDLPEVQSRLAEIKELFTSHGVRVHFISGATKQGVPELMLEIIEMLDKVGENKVEEEPPPVVFRPKPRARRNKELQSSSGYLNIGILGGTFDPVHFGHLAITKEARRKLALNRVIFVPAGQPWLKVNREITPASHRIKMIELALAGIPYFELSTVEIERQGPSYTVDTLSFLQHELGEKAKLFLILGWDSLNELPKWHKPAELLKMCQLVAFTRKSSNPPNLEALEVSVPGVKRSTVLLDMKPVDISSTDIRMRVAKGLTISRLVPDRVERYIREQKLYQ